MYCPGSGSFDFTHILRFFGVGRGGFRAGLAAAILACFAFSGPALAQGPGGFPASPSGLPRLDAASDPSVMILTDDMTPTPLAPYVFITPDPGGDLDAQEVARRHLGNLRGRREPAQILNLGLDPSPVWLVFGVQNAGKTKNWALSFGTRDDGRLGLARHIRLSEALSGRVLFEAGREGKSPVLNFSAHSILPLSVEPGQEALFVLRYVPEPGIPGTLALRLGPRDLAPEKTGGALPVDSALVLFFTAVAGFFVALGFVRREPVYGLFAACFVIKVALTLFPGMMLVLPDPILADLLTFLFALGVVIGLTMTLLFLEIDQNDLIPYAVCVVTAATLILCGGVAAVVLPDLSMSLPAFRYLPPVIGLCVILMVSLSQASAGKAGGYFYAAGWLFVLTGVLTTVAAVSGIAPLYAWTLNGFLIGSIPQALAFAGAALRKFRWQEREGQENVSREKRDLEARLRQQQIKDSADQAHLLRVIEREREIMTELRKREAQRGEEMRQAKEAADEANRAKSAFLAVVSHEIRTPMTGVMGMIRFLLETPLSKEQNEYAQTIQDSGNTMLALLNDILDFEKIESGRMELESVDFELRRLVSSITTLMSGQVSQKGIFLKAEIADDVPEFLRGDPTRLRQVILNLVNNAIKFTPQGGVTIHVRRSGMEYLPGGGVRHTLYFDVQDTGIGISPEAQKNLFNPFSQADSSIARQYGGTGLGLAICKRLVQAMGGTIGVSSTLREGSTFYFTATLSQGVAPVQASSGGGGNEEGAGRPERVLRVLIVDDNVINRKVLTGLVERAGHRTESASGGEEALHKAAERRYDLILMDIEMPGMSGDRAVQSLRALPDQKVSATPVIALTGNVRDEDIKRYYEANMNGFLAKPIDPAALNRTLENAQKGVFDNPVRVRAPMQADPLTEEDLSEDSFAESAAWMEREEREDSERPTHQGVPVFDDSQLGSLRSALGPNQLNELLDGVIEKAQEIIAGLEQSLEDKSAASVGARGHELKGMAGNFGLTELSRLAGDVEKAGRAGDLESAAPLVARLPQACACARTALKSWAAAGGDPAKS